MKRNKNPYDDTVRIAYDLYEKRGRVHGYDVEDWLEAERIVLERHAKEIKREVDIVKATKAEKSSGKTEPKTLKTSKKPTEIISKTTKKKSPVKKTTG